MKKLFPLTLFSPPLKALFFIFISTILLASAQASLASATIVVNSFTDDGLSNDGICTLREAVIAANKDKRSGNKAGECAAGHETDTIVLQAGTYLLSRTDNGREDSGSTGDLDITSNLTILGAGSGSTTINGNGITDRIFHVLPGGTAVIQDMTITNGHVPSDPGGGIYNGGILMLNHVIISNSMTPLSGGGVYNAADATLTMSNAAVVGNAATEQANGLYLAGQSTLTNVTISGNNFSGLINVGQTTLTNVTLVDSLVNSSGTLSLYNTLIAGSCSGALISAGHNLIANTTGCTISGNTSGNLLNVNPQLEPLANNGGGTLTHALLNTSPAVEAGDNANCPATDQRGITRPQGNFCDIGAYESEDPPQSGGTLVVNTAADADDGLCSFANCSLREALNHANNNPDTTSINFNIAGTGAPTIFPQSPLPTITAPAIIDGTTQSTSNYVVLDGSQAGPEAVGLTITAGGSTIKGLHIINFGSHGLFISEGDNNTVSNNTIANNGGNGVTIVDSINNHISDNDIHDNAGLSIDLGNDGATPNDNDDHDTGANFVQNKPVLLQAVPGASILTVGGYLNSVANQAYTIEFFAGANCLLYGGGTQTFLGSDTVTTDTNGNIYFSSDVALTAADNFITATATDSNGNTSELSDCIVVGPNNTSWPHALQVNAVPDTAATHIEQHLVRFGESRWYKFPVSPNSKVIVTLTNLPANYDLTVYKDISQAYNDLLAPQDLNILGAEFAPEAFSPEAFSPEAFSPEAFSPEAFSPEAFSPEAFSPEAFSPEAFSPEAFSPEAFSPEAFSPEAFSPEAFSPEAFSPEAFSPEAFSPEAFSPEAFSGAQLRSLIGVSAFRGTANEGLIFNTWNNTGFFYVRVRGANGSFSSAAPFTISIAVLSGNCGSVTPPTTSHSLSATAGGYETIILTDMNRMAGTAAEKAALQANLVALAARPEVKGVIVPVGNDAQVAAANAQADSHLACPYAKNLVAQSIKELIDNYQAVNPLKYVVLVGGDETIPFFRYPDNALLANEANFIPPVLDNTSSQATLRLGYVMGQDEYGATQLLSFKNSVIPVSGLAVGRVVESAAEANNVVLAYLSTPDGVIHPQNSPLVTGYDFLADVATAVKDDLEAGTSLTAETLISPRELAPADPASWTATDLRNALLVGRNDITFLAGHFSASGALAADYTTRLTAAEVMNAPINLQNVLIYSAGCHSGYNLVDEHGVPFVTEDPDWAQAFAYKGATFIGGTGYQYGDTEFIEYSERLYLEFTQQLRTGSGPVSIGQALVTAKQNYLAATPQMRGIHEKALLQATLFGLPMLQIEMGGSHLPTANEASIVGSTTPVATNPGLALGLRTADINLTPNFTHHTLALTNVTDNSTVTATYLAADDGIVTNPAEPTLPLLIPNVTIPNMALRGVAFRGGSYTDLGNIIPLTGAPTTEIRGVHAPFPVNFFYPVQIWRANYFESVADGSDVTRLAVTPAQFIADNPVALTGTLRRYNNVQFRLYYSNEIATYVDAQGYESTPALSAPPAIISVEAVPDGNGNVIFRAIVTGNPAAGIQDVFVTYTAESGPYAGQWQSLDLTQNSDDSTLWEGILPLNGTTPADIHYITQAFNGLGLGTMAANLGDSYEVDLGDDTPPEPTNLSLQILSSATGAYGTQASLSAQLTSNGQPVVGAVVYFNLGLQSRLGITDQNGVASVSLTLLGLPGSYQVQASFPGNTTLAPAHASQPFTITKQNTVLTLEQPAVGYVNDVDILSARLTDITGQPLSEKTLFFVIKNGNGSVAVARTAITDFAGRAKLGGTLPLAPGNYNVTVYFNGTIPLGSTTLHLEDARYNPASTNGTVEILNTPPIATADAYTTAENTALTVSMAAGVLANDSDLNNTPLTAVLVTTTSHGALTLNGDGSFTYTPAANFNGSDSFTYYATDGQANSATVAVTITITAVNDAPIAVNDAYQTTENSSLNVAAPGVLSNDSDPDGDSLTAVLVSSPTYGSLTLNANGSFIYTPTLNYFGPDSFTYTAFDGNLNSAVATVSITVNMGNSAPSCANATGSVDSVWPLDKSFISVNVINVSDADNDPINVVITAIFQDEEVGKGKNAIDGMGVGTSTAQVRAERDGSGDGRVYHIFYTASDGFGGQCSGELRIPTVPHDQSSPALVDQIDGGALYDSTQWQ